MGVVSMLYDVPDKQMGDVASAIVLPDAWLDRVLAEGHLADELKRVSEERNKTDLRLKRLVQVYVDGHVPEEEYRRQKMQLEE